MAAEPRRRRAAARRRSARGLAPAGLRSLDGALEARRIPDRRSREGDRGGGPAALAGRPALLRSVRPARAFTASRFGTGALALCCGALIALPGCGGGGSKGKPIPAEQANRMIALTRLADQQAA